MTWIQQGSGNIPYTFFSLLMLLFIGLRCGDWRPLKYTELIVMLVGPAREDMVRYPAGSNHYTAQGQEQYSGRLWYVNDAQLV